MESEGSVPFSLSFIPLSMEIPTIVVYHLENVQARTCFNYTRMERPHQEEVQELCHGASVASGALDGPGEFMKRTSTWRG